MDLVIELNSILLDFFPEELNVLIIEYIKIMCDITYRKKIYYISGYSFSRSIIHNNVIWYYDCAAGTLKKCDMETTCYPVSRCMFICNITGIYVYDSPKMYIFDKNCKLKHTISINYPSFHFVVLNQYIYISTCKSIIVCDNNGKIVIQISTDPYNARRIRISNNNIYVVLRDHLIAQYDSNCKKINSVEFKHDTIYDADVVDNYYYIMYQKINGLYIYNENGCLKCHIDSDLYNFHIDGMTLYVYYFSTADVYNIERKNIAKLLKS